MDQIPVEQLKGVGPRISERLQRLGILTLQDLLFHLPLRYQDRTRLRPLADLVIHEEVLVEGEVVDAQIAQGRRRSLKIRIEDGGGALLLRFFYFTRAQVEAMRPGRRLRCFGEVRQGPQMLEMVHPELQSLEQPAGQPDGSVTGPESGSASGSAIDPTTGIEAALKLDQATGSATAREVVPAAVPAADPAPGVEASSTAGQEVTAPANPEPAGRLTPIYPATEGLQQTSLRALTDQALDRLQRDPAALKDWIPACLTAPLHLPALADALLLLHRPPADAGAELTSALLERSHPAFQRLAFDEMLAHQLALRRLRRARSAQRAPVLQGDRSLRERLRAQLPFQLTGAQQRVLDEIAADLEQPRPMMRLLLGDVGSGKTVVAAMAALQVLEAGHQVALMAPTELLSEQHLQSLQQWLEPLQIELAWLSGRHSGSERALILERIADGQARVVVGTHALFQAEVRFAELGLVIIDEQHRFGVHQRLSLREKGERDGAIPHQLIMTATPIPRSLAMSVYGDLDLSEIDELPPGRKPIKTVALPDSRRDEVIERVQVGCRDGRQAYWVCTLVEESDALQAQAAEDAATDLRERLPGLRIGLVHGRIKAQERAPVMAAFKAGELDLLVATTVIEVGVDVPNASLMIIENPERLGLAQLHQLRGRVGRGSIDSVCLLMYHPPLTRAARERLDILRREASGFRIAEADLRMRGAGEVLGTRQAGAIQFRLADPMRDTALALAARHAADRLLRDWPEHVEPLIRRWLGSRDDYGYV
ncbi:ATP-dependent DNA helicase RecG [Lamprobacter modestohalophilus]|uniref:ATP-dependent DNA helicase RecG n=1 Tax=Lamprobacter modestohalophilus TaxID=1064514 RepID=A0A9X0W779_9GAMM|nr:ATP-dependent DNA helicase RecG [Lamprobacter modestohalophilus]MBK1618064.1 ATP-dependent DNA helicase RecG [Lamprobacter modestohalophilus]